MTCAFGIKTIFSVNLNPASANSGSGVVESGQVFSEPQFASRKMRGQLELSLKFFPEVLF